MFQLTKVQPSWQMFVVSHNLQAFYGGTFKKQI